MKIAYLIFVHHKPDQFRRLWEAIYNADDVFCVHVDAKASAALKAQVAYIVRGNRWMGWAPNTAHPETALPANVTFLPSRKIGWACWSMVQAELDGIAHLLKFDAEWDYVVNLSGQDMPLKSAEDIRETIRLREWFQLDTAVNFITPTPFSAIARTEPDDPHLSQRFCFELFGKLRRTRIPTFLPDSLRYKGSQWWMLTRAFCESMTPDDIHAIGSELRFTYCPDETFFQCMVMRKGAPWTLALARFVVWPGPKTLTEADLPAMLASDALFARKFDGWVPTLNE